MRIFFICQRVPFPPNRGDKITTFHEIKHLARHHEVHVFCLADGPGDLQNVPRVYELANTITAITVNRVKSKLRMLASLVSRKPFSVAAFNEQKLHMIVSQRYEELKPNLIIIYSSNVAQYAENLSDVPRIMQFADLDSLKWGAYAEWKNPPLRWVYQLESRRLLRYERLIACSFAHSLVCTTNEQNDFERLIPNAPVSLVGNGVDLDYFSPTPQPKRSGSIIFTGVMDYFPNIDAVFWFCNEIFPIVRAARPGATLTICGSNPTRAIRGLARRPGVTVTGRVADTRPYVGRSEISIAPIRIGRGIQNKVLEALAMGIPVVSSITAWKGTVIAHGEGILAADHAGEFAEHVLRLLSDSRYRTEMSRRARAAVEANYTWDAQLSRLDQVISGMLSSQEATR